MAYSLGQRSAVNYKKRGVFLSRANTLTRDIIFPFYSWSQFTTLAGGCAIVYISMIYFNVNDALDITLAGLLGGWLSLCFMSPAKLIFPPAYSPIFFRTIERMQFVGTANAGHYTYNRPSWMKWKNSDLVVIRNEPNFLIAGPLSTLAYIRRAMCEDQA